MTLKPERVALVVSILALVMAGWCLWETRELRARRDGTLPELHPLPLPPPSLPPGLTNLESRLKRLEAAFPSLGPIMSNLQLHFAKLYYAAEARNWDLADFERGEILENLDAAAALRPEERGVDLAAIIEAFKNTPLVSLKDAVEMKDRSLFREAYREAILMCNACHQSSGRPFIVITVPTNPPVSNQQWEYPAPGGK